MRRVLGKGSDWSDPAPGLNAEPIPAARGWGALIGQAWVTCSPPVGGVCYQRKGVRQASWGPDRCPSAGSQAPASDAETCLQGWGTDRGRKCLGNKRARSVKLTDKVSFLSAAAVTLPRPRTWRWSCLALCCFQLGLVLGAESGLSLQGWKNRSAWLNVFVGWVGGGGGVEWLKTDPGTHQAPLTSPSSRLPSLTFLPGRRSPTSDLPQNTGHFCPVGTCNTLPRIIHQLSVRVSLQLEREDGRHLVFPF